MKNKLFNEIIELLEELNCDECAPRVVRAKIKGIYDNLVNENDNISIRVDRSLQELDELGEDTNIPIHIKTRIWDIVSKLESIPQ
jgi:hypothetical protein